MTSLKALAKLRNVALGERVTEYELKIAYRTVVIAESGSRAEAALKLGVCYTTIARFANSRKPWMVLPGV